LAADGVRKSLAVGRDAAADEKPPLPPPPPMLCAVIRLRCCDGRDGAVPTFTVTAWLAAAAPLPPTYCCRHCRRMTAPPDREAAIAAAAADGLGKDATAPSPFVLMLLRHAP